MNELLASIPFTEKPEHDTPLTQAQSLCQRISSEAIQILILYRAEVSGNMYLNAVDIYSPQEFVAELAETAISFSRGRLKVTAHADDDVPTEWPFDRNFLNFALMNAVHNALQYAKSEVRFELGMEDGMLRIGVSDDSGGYPEHIIASDVADVKNIKAGSGLGLRFANFIAKAHENNGKSGFVRLRNEENRAVFELLIP
jgi:signal transduction histidine kinase